MKLALTVVLISLSACTAVWGQATAQIHGTVQDDSGSAVPGAEVKATETETGLTRTVSSGLDGAYVLTNLPVGPYLLEVTRAGFAKYVQSGIVLDVNSDPTIDPALKIGSVSEQVVVEANASQVETRSSGIGEVVQTQRIVELPLNGRNVTDLITLSGTAVQVGITRNSWFNNLPQISIAGQTYFGTGYSLDGANHLDYLTGTTLPVAFPDATQEFRVESSGQSAQRGLATSVSVVTRSGSNEVHGILFEFLRNDGFGSAHEYFSTPTTSSPLKRNQFGGTIGGPIKKNKLFYFGGFQGTILHSIPTFATAKVPTHAILNGDWTAFEGPACNNGTLKGGFVNNMISPSAYSKTALFVANKVLQSLGATPDKCGNVTYGVPNFENDFQYVGKVDYQLNDEQSLFFRVVDTHELVPSTQNITPDLLAAAGGTSQFAQSYAIGHTDVISPTLVQTARIAVNRTATTQIPYNEFSWCDAGVQIWCGANPNGLSSFAVTTNGGFNLSGGAGSNFWRMTSYAANEDLNWVKGSHQMTFGAGALVGRYGEVNDFAGAGQFTFSGNTTGNGLADFFLGRPSAFFQGLPNTAATRQNFVNAYFTDSWKINSRLTFNYGVRWEPFIPQTVSNGHISNFDMGRFLAGVKSTVFVNAPPGFYFPGDPGFPDKSATYHKWAHFDPRGGIAWDPKGDGKTSVRASYAFGYAYIPGIYREDQAGSNPWGGRATYTPLSFENPFGSTPGGNPYPYTVNPNVTFTPGGQFLTTPYALPTPTTYSWNVGLQHQFGSSWIASATYIGSRVQHLYVNVPINYGEIVGPIEATGCAVTATNCTASGNPSNLQVRRVLSLLNPAAGKLVGNMDEWNPAGYQNYQGGLFSLQKRFSQGISMNANWTWSHCIGVFQGFNSKPEETSTVPNNPTFDRGNCDSDRRNIVNITAVAVAPRFSNSVARMAITGWQLAAIYRFTSGTPLSIQDGSGQDRELTGINHQRPNVVLPGDVYTGHDGPGVPYLNVKAFALPPFGTIGNLGWNSIVSPTYWDMDLALSRQFHVTERQRLEVRADAFNISNSFVTLVSGAQGTGMGTASPQSAAVPTYDSITAGSNFSVNNAYAQPTRKIQFALKYIF